MARSDKDLRKVGKAYGRYSGSDQSDERRRDGHGVDGAAADAGPGYQREDPDGGKYGNPGTIDRVGEEIVKKRVERKKVAKP